MALLLFSDFLRDHGPSVFGDDWCKAEWTAYGFSGIEEDPLRRRDRGRVIRAIVSRTRKLPARTSSCFRLLGVRGPPRGMWVAISTTFLWSAGS